MTIFMYLSRFSITLILAFVLATLATYAEAQVVIDNMVDRSLGRYEVRFEGFIGVARNIMLNTFYLLAVIEVTWSLIVVIIGNKGLQALLSTIITRIMFIGFFSFLLNRGSTTAWEIFRSFTQLAAGTALTDGGISPGSVSDAGNDIFVRMFRAAADIGTLELLFDDQTSLSTPIIIFFAGMAALLVMSILSAHLGVLVLETFIAASAGLILLGLGSNRWTYNYAVTYLKYAMSIGMKLFVLTIIVGMTTSEVDRFLRQVDVINENNAFALLAFLIFAVIVSTLAPKSVRGMMDGVSVGSANTSIPGKSKNKSGSKNPVSQASGQVSKLFTPR